MDFCIECELKVFHQLILYRSISGKDVTYPDWLPVVYTDKF